jgi:hypothetical protein
LFKHHSSLIKIQEDATLKSRLKFRTKEETLSPSAQTQFLCSCKKV